MALLVIRLLPSYSNWRETPLIDKQDTSNGMHISKWAGIVGRWSFEGNRASYNGPEQPEWPFGICVSNIRLLSGEVRVTVKQSNTDLDTDGRILLGYQSMQSDYFTIGLGGHGKAYNVVHWSPSTGWRPLASAGSEANLPKGEPYEIFVRVHGQRIILDVNAVRVLEYVLPIPLPLGQVGLFAWGQEGGMEFSNMSVMEQRGDAFVVMQFSGFEELYRDVIEPVTKEFGLRPYRADQKFGPGSIIEDIIQGIERSQVVIAEITPANENVFYEVGYAHALKKPTILLAEKDKKLPFDLSGFRCLFYQNSIGGKRLVEEGLRNHLRAILHE